MKEEEAVDPRVFPIADENLTNQVHLSPAVLWDRQAHRHPVADPRFGSTGFSLQATQEGSERR